MDIELSEDDLEFIIITPFQGLKSVGVSGLRLAPEVIHIAPHSWLKRSNSSKSTLGLFT